MNGTPLAQGRTAEIFAWEPGKILKLFRYELPAILPRREVELAQLIHAAGIKSPAVGDLVEVDGRLGVVYERLEGPTMLRDLSDRPWRFSAHARSLAVLQAEVHTHRLPDLPAQRVRLRAKIKQAPGLPAHLCDAALARLESLPDGEQVCHNDFHPDNVILTPRGPVIIDWMDSNAGNPLADVARTVYLIAHAVPISGTSLPVWVRLGRRMLLREYLNHYFRLNPDGREQVQAWMPVIAAARLTEAIEEERKGLLKLIEQGLTSSP